eukprot:jgi/Phyca11/16765/fgenesh1_pg.PHYCAscaffold_22_\
MNYKKEQMTVESGMEASSVTEYGYLKPRRQATTPKRVRRPRTRIQLADDDDGVNEDDGIAVSSGVVVAAMRPALRDPADDNESDNQVQDNNRARAQMNPPAGGNQPGGGAPPPPARAAAPAAPNQQDDDLETMDCAHLQGEAGEWLTTLTATMREEDKTLSYLVKKLRKNRLRQIGFGKRVPEESYVEAFLNGINNEMVGMQIRGHHPETLDDAVQLAEDASGVYGEGVKEEQPIYDKEGGAIDQWQQSARRDPLSIAALQALILTARNGHEETKAAAPKSKARLMEMKAESHEDTDADDQPQATRRLTHPNWQERSGRGGHRSSGHYGPMDTPDIQQRKANTKCGYCGKAGHWWRECRTRLKELNGQQPAQQQQQSAQATARKNGEDGTTAATTSATPAATAAAAPGNGQR